MDGKKILTVITVLAVLLAAVSVVWIIAGRIRDGRADDATSEPAGSVTAEKTEEITSPGSSAADTDPVSETQTETVEITTVADTPAATTEDVTEPPVTTEEVTTVVQTTEAETTAEETTAEETTEEATTEEETTAAVTEPVTTDVVTTETPPVETSAVQVPPEGSFDVVMSFVGDCQFADNYDNQGGPFTSMWNSQTPGYFLEKVKSIFEADDMTVINLECVLSDSETIQMTPKSGTAYWYRGREEYIGIATTSSVEAVSIANNHTGDYGEGGYQDTIRCAKNAGLATGTYYETFYFEKNGYRIAVICDGLWNYWQETDIINRIHEAEKQSDFQIVYWHGGTEYRHSPEQWQIDASHDIVDAGADLVIGNHAHVLQPKEVYNGVTIVYSLGNFCYGGMITCENRTVIYQLRLTVGENGVILGKEDVIIPCYVYTGPRNNFQPAPITDPDEKQRVLDFMNGLINSPV